MKEHKKEKNIDIFRALKLPIVINYLLLPIIILFAWWFVSSNQITPTVILPTINTVVKSFFEQASSGQLLIDLSASLFRVMQGFVIASFLGVLLGVVMGISPAINKFFSLTFSAIRQVPMLAWIPLIILWFGIGESSKIIVIIIGAFFPVLVNTINGINQIPPGYIEVGKMFKLSKWDMFRKIYLPSAIPSIFVGLKLAMGFSWMIVVAAELIAASSGIGYRINDARSLMQSEVVLVGIFVIATVGILMDQVLVLISRALTPWTNKK